MTVYKHFYAADKLFAGTSHAGPRALKRASVSAGQTYDPQQQEEQGHNVQVEVESSVDVFLWRDLVLLVFPTQDELSVEHQILQRGAGGGGAERRRERSHVKLLVVLMKKTGYTGVSDCLHFNSSLFFMG